MYVYAEVCSIRLIAADGLWLTPTAEQSPHSPLTLPSLFAADQASSQALEADTLSMVHMHPDATGPQQSSPQYVPLSMEVATSGALDQ